MPKKRMNGEGTYHKRPNGLWEWQIMLGYQRDGRRKMKSIYARTQKELKQKAKQFMEDYKSRPQLDSTMPFSKWADIWYEGMKGQVSDTTYDGYAYTLKILKAYFGDTRLEDIKAIHVEGFLKSLVEDGKSKSYITKLRGMLFQVMKKAEANELIFKNPVAVADKVKAGEQEPSKKDAFTAAEIKRLMERLPKDRMGLSIRLMLGTGMRTQEVMALEPKHIAEDGSVIQVRQAITMTKGTPKIGPPNTKNSYRDIPVPESLRDVAAALRKTDQQYIWHGEKSALCNPSTFRHQYTLAISQVGEVRVLSPHCCRHSYISHLQAMGVDMETIQSLSGHADIDMTEHYLHVQQEVKTSAVAKLNEMFDYEKICVNFSGFTRQYNIFQDEKTERTCGSFKYDSSMNRIRTKKEQEKILKS